MTTQPRFTPDELILMLDFVLERKSGVPRSLPGLSDQLRALPSNADLSLDPAFRSLAGLRTSLGYMVEIDEGRGDWPAGHEYAGRPSLRPHFKAVWHQFGQAPEALKARVAAIAVAPAAAEEVEEPDFDDGFVEGRAFYALHRRHERSAAAVRRKKQGAPICGVCGFDFGERYGQHGVGYIECHHVVPVATAGVILTREEDLVLVCANCHRMMHRGTPPPSVDELRDLLEDGGS
jgi:5-methylcytosine-specific restriction protein A